MSKNKEIQDFPLESQQELSQIKVTIAERYASNGREMRLILTQQVEEECMYVMLTKDQVVEIIDLCRGRLIGNLTGLPLAFIGQVDQTMAHLREHQATLEDIHRNGESAVVYMLDTSPTKAVELFHTMALVCRLLLAEQATLSTP